MEISIVEVAFCYAAITIGNAAILVGVTFFVEKKLDEAVKKIIKNLSEGCGKPKE